MSERNELFQTLYAKGLSIFLKYAHDCDLKGNVKLYKEVSSEDEVDLYMLGWDLDRSNNIWSFSPPLKDL